MRSSKSLADLMLVLGLAAALTGAGALGSHEKPNPLFLGTCKRASLFAPPYGGDNRLSAPAQNRVQIQIAYIVPSNLDEPHFIGDIFARPDSLFRGFLGYGQTDHTELQIIPKDADTRQ